jgi:hypothetical protein
MTSVAPHASAAEPSVTATEVRDDLAGADWTQRSALFGADGYRSPLIERLAADGGDRLTLVGLRRDVPLVKAGNAAVRDLANPDRKPSRDQAAAPGKRPLQETPRRNALSWPGCRW